MVSSVVILAVLLIYMTLLFLAAIWGERRGPDHPWVNNRLVYSLGLTVMFTSWTFYGSVGRAANGGMSFLVFYLGLLIPFFFWSILVGKMVRIKNEFHITSIADFISARYNKSQAVAALVTIIALVGAMPYIALQIKGIISAFVIMSIPETTGAAGVINKSPALVVSGLMIVFTILFGARRLDPTERHPGMVMAIAVEAVIKLVAFLAVGFFVVYFMFDGLGDIFQRLSERAGYAALDMARSDAGVFSRWTSLLFISMFAVVLLPRQFHMIVVENSNQDHIRTAMWLFPLYLLLITIFCFPIAMGGLLSGLPADQADTFVLSLPFRSGNVWLSLMVYVGGLSAATGMIMICAMTMSTMLTNHILLPLIEWLEPLAFLRRRLLECRWAAITLVIMTGYFFEKTVGGSYMLVNMGLISFVAVSQFGPAVLGGLFWNKGNRVGALWGLSLGFLVWLYTMILPAFVHSGWISGGILSTGPWGLGFLRPEALFGISKIDPVVNSVFWSLVLNVSAYVLGSVFSESFSEEQRIAERFIWVLKRGPAAQRIAPFGQDISLESKLGKVKELLNRYYFPDKTAELINTCLFKKGLDEKSWVNIIELADFYEEIERILSGAVGAAAARGAMDKAGLFSHQEAELLSAGYAEILADLKISPEELKRKIDYFQEREALLKAHAAELEEKIRQREQEIVERKKVEEQLVKTEKKYRNIFENAVDGIFQTSPDGGFISVNLALAKMLGFDSAEELIENVTDIKTQLYRDPNQREDFMDLMVRDQMVNGFEAEFLKNGGGTMWASLHARPVYGPDGELLFFEGTFQDVTARKQTEEENRRLEEQLRQSQKMEALGKLAGGVAHDFNNLLQAMSGYVQLLIMKKSPDEPDYKYLQEIERTAERASDIVRRLLTFSRKTSASIEAIELDQVISDTIKILSHTIPKQVNIVSDTAPDLKELFADAAQMEQLILNLAGNACDAMSEGGTLHISARNRLLEGTGLEAASDLPPGDYIELVVSDTGHGMTPETRERIFEPFFTTKEVGRGTGLGLSIVYGIVKFHQGAIFCDSREGEGTRFTVLLPLSGEKTVSQTSTRKKTLLPIGGSEKILLVDDETNILDIARETLEDQGYEVIMADSGEKALEIYRRLGHQIDLVLLDLGMPGIGGEKCLKEILRLDEKARIIVASGYIGHQIAKAPQDYGAREFLGKPYALKEMLEKVRKTLDG